MIGVYIHIPFCRTLCPYCDFVKVRTDHNVPDPFVDALCTEIAAFVGPDKVRSVFLGGGTPSLLSPAALQRLLDALNNRFDLHDPEITLEANPDDITDDLVASWRTVGINRISLGVQSFNEDALRYLGRRHDAKQAIVACETVAKHFTHWNMDLIYGAPPHDAWPNTLARCIQIDPPHVAAYSLTYEAGTPFERRANEAIPSDTALRLYQQLEEALAAYDHYEISNFAKAGQPSIHNIIYWQNESYAGFGTGAYSFIDSIRARNHTALDAYLDAPGKKMEALTLRDDEIRLETLIQYFRLRVGLKKADYEQRFGHTITQDYGPQIKTLITRGLLEETTNTLRPTQQGFYLNNEIGLALVDG